MGGIQSDTSSSQVNPWWWVPNAMMAAAGVGLAALGVFGHTDQQELVTTGIAVVVAAGAHAAGKQSPTP
jgi:hypothetical protein